MTFTDPKSGAQKQIQLTVEKPIITVELPAQLKVGDQKELKIRVTNSLNQWMSGVSLSLTPDPAVFTIADTTGTTHGADIVFSTLIEGKAANTGKLIVKAVDADVSEQVDVTVLAQ